MTERFYFSLLQEVLDNNCAGSRKQPVKLAFLPVFPKGFRTIKKKSGKRKFFMYFK